MCGICGKVNLIPSRSIDRREIEAMRDTMVLRGPDAGGVYVDRQTGLGHRRLSIIDLEASAQPMSNEDGSVWIVFNGEIYNFMELGRSFSPEVTTSVPPAIPKSSSTCTRSSAKSASRA